MRRGYEYATLKLYKMKKQSSKFFESRNFWILQFYAKKNTLLIFWKKSQKFMNSTILQEMRKGYEYAILKLYKIKKNSLVNFLVQQFLNYTIIRQKKTLFKFFGKNLRNFWILQSTRNVKGVWLFHICVYNSSIVQYFETIYQICLGVFEKSCLNR